MQECPAASPGPISIETSESCVFWIISAHVAFVYVPSRFCCCRVQARGKSCCQQRPRAQRPLHRQLGWRQVQRVSVELSVRVGLPVLHHSCCWPAVRILYIRESLGVTRSNCNFLEPFAMLTTPLEQKIEQFSIVCPLRRPTTGRKMGIFDVQPSEQTRCCQVLPSALCCTAVPL